ncbi:unnamed protein product [Lasius platythorax]|uniref:Uncharacterized protein n=1 Tax=Lasius platythorax TaxID=488582 RepID=A0AAV2NSB5_9HYME
MFHLGIFAVLWSAMTCSFGFTMDRSALVPSTWDTAPSLDTYQRVDSALNDKMQVTGMDRILPAVDAKVSAKLTERMAENQTREKRATTESAEIRIKFVNNTTSTTRNYASNFSEENTNVAHIPRNVILLLIDERYQDEKREENLWDYKNRLPFAIEGFLQRCHDKIEIPGISLDGALISENKEKDCDREHILRANIGELLSWARQTRGMTTGAVHSSNFFISPFPRKFDVPKESDVKLELHKNKRDLNDVWQIIGDLDDRAKSFPLVTADPKTETMNYNDTWDVFDMFSKISVAIFRSLLESLGRNGGSSEDDFSLHRSFPLKKEPTVTNLIENTIKNLKSISNNNGYILIAIVPRNEGVLAVDLVTRETSPNDTLLVVTQICAGDEESVPFVAQGPNREIFREVVTIGQLPIGIRKAIAGKCRDSECINRQKRDIPIVSHLPIEIFSQLPARKRVTRDKDAVEKPETSKLTDTIKDTVRTVETTIVEKKNQARFYRSTSSKTMPCGLATTFSVAASVVAVAVWASS